MSWASNTKEKWTNKEGFTKQFLLKVYIFTHISSQFAIFGAHTQWEQVIQGENEETESSVSSVFIPFPCYKYLHEYSAPITYLHVFSEPLLCFL